MFPNYKSNIIPFITNSDIIQLFDLELKKLNYIKVHSDIIISMDTFGPFIITAGKDK